MHPFTGAHTHACMRAHAHHTQTHTFALQRTQTLTHTHTHTQLTLSHANTNVHAQAHLLGIIIGRKDMEILNKKEKLKLCTVCTHKPPMVSPSQKPPWAHKPWPSWHARRAYLRRVKGACNGGGCPSVCSG